MNAEFIVGGQGQVLVRVSDVTPENVSAAGRVVLEILCDGTDPVLLPLKRSEARAIASALMGAAAEL